MQNIVYRSQDQTVVDDDCVHVTVDHGAGAFDWKVEMAPHGPWLSENEQTELTSIIITVLAVWLKLPNVGLFLFILYGFIYDW